MCNGMCVCMSVCLCVCHKRQTTHPNVRLSITAGNGGQRRDQFDLSGCWWERVMGCGLLEGRVSYLRGCHGVHLVFFRKRSTEGQEAGVDVELSITGREKSRGTEHTNKHVFILLTHKQTCIHIINTQTNMSFCYLHKNIHVFLLLTQKQKHK